MAKFKVSDFNNKNFLALAGNGVIAGFSFGFIALLTRALSKDDVGMWFFFLTIYGIGDAVRNGFLGVATIKFYASTTGERAREVLGSVWFLAIAITGIMMLANVVFVPFIPFITNKELVLSIRWFGFTMLSSLPFSLIFWVLVAEERYGKVLWLRLINYVSMILYVTVLIALKKMTLEALMWCNLLTNALTSAAGLAWGLGRFGTIIHRSRACIMEIVHFGKYSLGSTVASKLLGSTDTFVISFFLGPAALAVYSLAQKLMELVEFLLRSFVGTGMSGMAVAYNSGNVHQTTYIFRKYAGMLTIAFIPLTILALIFSDLGIYILAGHKYAGTEAANIFRIFMVLALIYPVDRFIGATLDIIHKPKINFYKVLIMLFFAITADLTCVLLFKSLYAVAFASFFTLFSGAIFGYINLNKYLSISLPDVLTTGYTEMNTFLQNMRSKVKAN